MSAWAACRVSRDQWIPPMNPTRIFCGYDRAAEDVADHEGSNDNCSRRSPNLIRLLDKSRASIQELRKLTERPSDSVESAGFAKSSSSCIVMDAAIEQTALMVLSVWSWEDDQRAGDNAESLNWMNWVIEKSQDRGLAGRAMMMRMIIADLPVDDVF